MGLFGSKNCPQEEEYFKIYGIPAPQKWKPENCLTCQFMEENKCQYKKAMARQAENLKRGQPVLIKRVHMSSTPEKRKKAESDAVKKACFSPDEQKEYWVISDQIDITWETADQSVRQELLEHLDQWKVHLEKGLAPGAAYEQVKEWIKQREEFRHSPHHDQAN